MTYELRKHDDPILFRKCEEVEPGDDLSFIADMRRIMKEGKGVGIAAPQIGVAKRVIIVRKWALINPIIQYASPVFGTELEGCLSFPDKRAMVRRALYVTLAFYDEKWTFQRRSYDGYEARIVQHEIDHLDGICRVSEGQMIA